MADTVQIFHDPEQRLHVPQPAFAFLDVGLKQVHVAVLAQIPLVAFGQLRFDEFGACVLEQLRPEFLVEFVRQALLAINETMLEHRSPDRHVIPAEQNAILHGSAGMPHLYFQIPKDVQCRFDYAFHPRRYFSGVQEQQVDVGLRRHLSATVPADRRDADRFRLAGFRHERTRRQIKNRRHDAVGQMRVRSYGFQRREGIDLAFY